MKTFFVIYSPIYQGYWSEVDYQFRGLMFSAEYEYLWQAEQKVKVLLENHHPLEIKNFYKLI